MMRACTNGWRMGQENHTAMAGPEEEGCHVLPLGPGLSSSWHWVLVSYSSEGTERGEGKGSWAQPHGVSQGDCSSSGLFLFGAGNHLVADGEPASSQIWPNINSCKAWYIHRRWSLFRNFHSCIWGTSWELFCFSVTLLEACFQAAVPPDPSLIHIRQTQGVRLKTMEPHLILEVRKHHWTVPSDLKLELGCCPEPSTSHFPHPCCPCMCTALAIVTWLSHSTSRDQWTRVNVVIIWKYSCLWEGHRITQNHRITGVGRDLQRSLSPTPMPKQAPCSHSSQAFTHLKWDPCTRLILLPVSVQFN